MARTQPLVALVLHRRVLAPPPAPCQSGRSRLHRDVRRLSTAFTTKGPSSCTNRVRVRVIWCWTAATGNHTVPNIPPACSFNMALIAYGSAKKASTVYGLPRIGQGGFRRKGCGCGTSAVGRSRMTPPVFSQSGFFPVNPLFVAFDAATPPPQCLTSDRKNTV